MKACHHHLDIDACIKHRICFSTVQYNIRFHAMDNGYRCTSSNRSISKKIERGNRLLLLQKGEQKKKGSKPLISTHTHHTHQTLTLTQRSSPLSTKILEDTNQKREREQLIFFLFFASSYLLFFRCLQFYERTSQQ